MKEKRVEEMKDLEPSEVSLTFAPAVKEEFLMWKNALTDEELEELAKSLGVSVDDLPDEEIEKAAREKVEKAKKPKEYYEEYAEPQKASLDSAVKMAARVLSPHMDKLPEAVRKFFESKKARRKEEYEEYGERKKSELVELIKSEFPDIVEEIQQPLREKLEATAQEVQKLREERELQEALEIAKSLPGDPEKTARRLVQLKKSLSPEDYQEFIEEQRSAWAVVQKSELFTQISKSQAAPVSAEERVLQKAEEIVAKSSDRSAISRAKAIEMVLAENPELAREYEREMRQRASMPNTEV